MEPSAFLLGILPTKGKNSIDIWCAINIASELRNLIENSRTISNYLVTANQKCNSFERSPICIKVLFDDLAGAPEAL